MKSPTPRRRPRANSPRIGAPGSHPVGTGIGAVAGGMTAGAMGLISGPAGALTGGAMGVLVGGFAGRCVAEKINPTVLEAFWRAKQNHPKSSERIDDFRRASA